MFPLKEYWNDRREADGGNSRNITLGTRKPGQLGSHPLGGWQMPKMIRWAQDVDVPVPKEEEVHVCV